MTILREKIGEDVDLVVEFVSFVNVLWDAYQCTLASNAAPGTNDPAYKAMERDLKREFDEIVLGFPDVSKSENPVAELAAWIRSRKSDQRPRSMRVG